MIIEQGENQKSFTFELYNKIGSVFLSVFYVGGICGKYGYVVEFEDGSFYRGHAKTIRACIEGAKREIKELTGPQVLFTKQVK